MRVLLTNDDGVDSPGLQALYEAVSAVAGVEVYVIAPDHNWSISGHNKTMDRPLRVNEIKWYNGLEVLTTDGTPADCVSLAGLGLIPETPDLVISGINLGPNLGDDVTYSGTVAAAMEAHIAGIPAVALSLNEYTSFNFNAAATFATRLISLFQLALQGKEGGLMLTSDLFLNINVPNINYDEVTAIEITRQGRRIYKDELFRREDPRGRAYYWIGGERPDGHLHEGTDIAAVAENKISITPMMLDLTNYRMIEKLKGWQF
ncbi:MAG TPA: 5'/3'-nucleotidase SurE [Chloroflexia bacterium]|nr:5'/3'-nucleotidase SurE [Chloroflexia bacterium]